MYKCFIYTIIFICIISIFSLIASARKMSKKNYKNILAVCIINSIFLLFLNLKAPSLLSLDLGFETLLLFLISIIAGLIYIITVIVCRYKINKNYSKDIQENILEEIPEDIPEDIPYNKHFAFAAKLVILIPILIFSFVFFKELYLIRNSDLILIYTSRGNGGLGDSHSFAFAVNDQYCESFDIGVDFGGYKIEKSLPKGMIKSDSEYEYVNERGKQSINVNDYYIEINDFYTHNLVIYKNNELLHQINYNNNYFNIDCKNVFYRQ